MNIICFNFFFNFKGQPNRTTGECDEDALIIGVGAANFTVCGQNHGQHREYFITYSYIKQKKPLVEETPNSKCTFTFSVYYNLPTGSVSREADELPTTMSTKIRLRARGADTPRLWMLRLAQMPLAHAAPHGCLQHYTDNNGMPHNKQQYFIRHNI